MINEATTPYDNPDVDYGLMTLEEFYKARNPKNEWHPDTAYKSSISSLNRDYSKRSVYSYQYRYDDKHEIVANSKGYLFYTNDEPAAVIIGEHLYYNNRFNLKMLPFSFTDYDQKEFLIEMPPQKTKVKYLADYISKLDPVSQENMEEFSVLLQNINVGGKQFKIKTEKDYGRDKGKLIAILNEENLVVAQASNEYGTTLLQVAQEYSGYGFGKILGKYWYGINPRFKSGGFTNAGYNNAKHIWADRVRLLLKNGWYKDLIKSGKISYEKVKKIISELPEKKKQKEFEKENTKKEPLIYADGITFVIYDKKFLTDMDEKYIYAFGFYRENETRVFLYTIDYDEGFGKIANMVAFQMARDEGDTIIDISSEASDMIEKFDIDGVEYNNGNAVITKDLMNLKDFSKLERILRKPVDKYDEIYNSLLEMAESKWK